MAATRDGRLVGERLPWLMALLALVMTAAWAVPVALTRAHGFDISDEGSYVLSYRWWAANPRNYTGAQYLYGPVFEALHYSIGGLRLFRLATVLAAHALFGWAFVSWLQARFPYALWSPARTAAVIASMVAVGGVTYGWLPLSPGYDDVVAFGCLAVMAAFFRSWRAVLRTGRLAIGPALALPAPVLAILLARWSSGVVLMTFLAGVFLVVATSLRARGWGPFLAAGLVCTGAVVLLFDAAVAPLGRVVPPIVDVNRLAAGSSHSAGVLLGDYVRGAVDVLGRTAPLVTIMLVLSLVALVASRSRMRAAAPWVLSAGPVVAVAVVSASGAEPWPEGGVHGLDEYAAGLVALVAGAAVVCGAAMKRAHTGVEPRRRGGARELAGVVSMLALLPVAQALGTAQPLSNLAVNLAASWFALVLLCVVGAPSRAARLFTVTTALTMLVLCTSVGVDGVLLHPYRTTAYHSSDRTLGGAGPLGGVALSDRDRAQLGAVRRALAPASQGGRPVVVLDEITGLALLTDGRSLGEPWGSAEAPERLAAGIRAACRDTPWKGAEKPVIIAWRPWSQAVTDALEGCGAHLETGDYRETRLPVVQRTIRVLTPRS